MSPAACLVSLAALAGGLLADGAGAHPGEAHAATPGAIGGHGLFGGLAGARRPTPPPRCRASRRRARRRRRPGRAPRRRRSRCRSATATTTPTSPSTRSPAAWSRSRSRRSPSSSRTARTSSSARWTSRPTSPPSRSPTRRAACCSSTSPTRRKPEFLSRYNATECDQLLEDVNCGAFVDLSADGKTAYLSIQKLTLLPTLPLNLNALNQSVAGVDVIDLANPRKPVKTQFYPVLGLGGVHTVRSHTIPAGPSSAAKPRAPGEYVISNQNGVGIDIAKVTKVAGKRLLTTVRQLGTIDLAATIQNNEVHDTFIQNDPLDGRTYLYNAAGFATGFNVYDITDPSKIKQVAEWDLTPECEKDWYAHTIDVTHRDGRRYVTMPAEMLLQLDPQLAQRPGGDVRRRQGRGLRHLRRQRRQARAAVDRRRDRLLQARPGERQEVARAGAARPTPRCEGVARTRSSRRGRTRPGAPAAR